MITYNETNYITTKNYTEEEVVRILSGGGAIELDTGEYLLHYEVTAGTGGSGFPEVPEDATFAEVDAQGDELKNNFILDYVRDKINANLLEHIGSATNRGTYYNSGTNWRDLLPIINSYLSEDLEQDVFNYLMVNIGTHFVLKVVFGDNRIEQRDRFSEVHTISELDKEYTFALEQSGVAWSYDLIIEIRSSDNKTKFKIQHGVSAGDRSKHGDQYGAIRGLWFEEIT